MSTCQQRGKRENPYISFHLFNNFLQNVDQLIICTLLAKAAVCLIQKAEALNGLLIWKANDRLTAHFVELHLNSVIVVGKLHNEKLIPQFPNLTFS